MDTNAAPATAAARPRRSGMRGFFMRQLLSWHWISAAISLLGMVGFAITGITLNHAGDIAAQPVVQHDTAALPAPLQAELATITGDGDRALPPRVAAWLNDEFSAHTAGRNAEWSADEVYLAMARPGGDAWISIDRASGAVEYENTWRGWVAYFNDLHKGRDAGPAWGWFIDIFAAACVIFSLTGFGLLWVKSPARPSTWPLIGLSALIPLLLALFFIH
jgi:hypothetical protein